MIANILIAIGFFAFGFLVGGVFTLKMSKKVKEETEDIAIFTYNPYAN